MQRLTIGACLAIKMHSKAGNMRQLRHDLRNGPNHVFGDQSQCNPAFCKVTTKENDDWRRIGIGRLTSTKCNASHQNTLKRHLCSLHA